MLECTSCNTKNLDESKFCIICGNQLFKECKKCSIKLPVIANFCYECGTKLQSANIKNHEQDKQAANSENESSSTKKRRLSETEFKVKVNILMGDRMLQLNTEDGGGWRKVNLHNDDDYTEIFRKILDVYFPREGQSKLGVKSDYIIRLLDFKKEVINKTQMINFETYIKKNGLTTHKFLFYIQLWRRWEPSKTATETQAVSTKASTSTTLSASISNSSLANKKPRLSQDATISSTNLNSSKSLGSSTFLKTASVVEIPTTKPKTRPITISSSSSSSSSSEDEPVTVRQASKKIVTPSKPKESPSVKLVNGVSVSKNSVTKKESSSSSSESSESSSSSSDEEPPPPKTTKISTNEKVVSSKINTQKPVSTPVNQPPAPIVPLLSNIKRENLSPKKPDVSPEPRKEQPKTIETPLIPVKKVEPTAPVTSNKPVSTQKPIEPVSLASNTSTTSNNTKKSEAFFEISEAYTSFDNQSFQTAKIIQPKLGQPDLKYNGRLPQPVFPAYNTFSPAKSNNNDKNYRNNNNSNSSIKPLMNNSHRRFDDKNDDDRYDKNKDQRSYNDSYRNNNRQSNRGRGSSYQSSSTTSNKSYRDDSYRNNPINNRYNNNNNYNDHPLRYNNNNNRGGGYHSNNNDRRFDDYKTPTQKIIERSYQEEDSDEERKKLKMKTAKDVNKTSN